VALQTLVKWSTKRRTDLPPVDIYCIGAIGFYRTLIQPKVTSFVTSLYEIDQIIEEKEAATIQENAAKDELSNEELID
jgi:hypothetical protein